MIIGPGVNLLKNIVPNGTKLVCIDAGVNGVYSMGTIYEIVTDPHSGKFQYMRLEGSKNSCGYNGYGGTWKVLNATPLSTEDFL